MIRGSIITFVVVVAVDFSFFFIVFCCYYNIRNILVVAAAATVAAAVIIIIIIIIIINGTFVMLPQLDRTRKGTSTMRVQVTCCTLDDTRRTATKQHTNSRTERIRVVDCLITKATIVCGKYR